MGGTRHGDPFGDVDAQPSEDDSAAVLRTVGRVIKKFRERAGLTQTELGEAIGYGMEQVSSVERGRRAPSPDFLTAADEVLNAGGVIAELKDEVERARYPKKVRDLTEVESRAVEICTWDNSVVNGLLQTEEYARALFEMRRPMFSPEDLERRIAGRAARQEIIREGKTAPALGFVHDEAALRRPIGGKEVLRRQLKHLLHIAELGNVEVQVLPLDSEDNAGIAGPFNLLRLREGVTVAHHEVQRISQLVSDPQEIQILELRYGIIRAQALSPRESVAFIERMLGET
ncbi:helix-turn-helix transcriptional regulator [Streptomyces sp. TS71-3]|uniref:helix-turn-helix domain-containing protein n=1 Tax=Streptomyces sp. TS71-3 TaxID=2733862 RepID=UPI001B0E601D|nr:helix-turn-helix transcriptional regulator [Streptomyces sp. TS71-3]GHJ41127.1 transcriptional regulator [Streptomyces sp. TS71-3]